MTKEQTAQQLELAAQILRTGHPWEYRVTKVDGEEWHDGKISDVSYYAHYSKIRLALAIPPDNRPLHNPDNLTAEQVGVGYRLALPGEKLDANYDYWLFAGGWKKGHGTGIASELNPGAAMRLPLSVPWPEPADPYAELKAAHAAGKVIQYNCGDERAAEWEDIEDPEFSGKVSEYRIKPEEPAFQLPPPPPSMRWHREDGWKSDDLPSGYRPLVAGEIRLVGDSLFPTDGDDTWRDKWQTVEDHWMHPQNPAGQGSYKSRTTRSLVFNHAGKTWTYHRPGDPMPCDGERVLQILLSNGEANRDFARAKFWDWKSEDEESDVEIIGWRYAEPQTKTVPLGPEDVPPGSVFRSKDQPTTAFWTVSQVWEDGFYLRGDSMPWDTARERMQINRSLSKGQWNPDAWEPCSKTIPADENLAEPKSR